MEGEGIPYPHLHHRHSRGELKGEMVVGGRRIDTGQGCYICEGYRAGWYLGGGGSAVVGGLGPFLQNSVYGERKE